MFFLPYHAASDISDQSCFYNYSGYLNNKTYFLQNSVPHSQLISSRKFYRVVFLLLKAELSLFYNNSL